MDKKLNLTLSPHTLNIFIIYNIPILSTLHIYLGILIRGQSVKINPIETSEINGDIFEN